MSNQTPEDEIEVKTQEKEQAPESESAEGAENGTESPTQPDTASDKELSLEAALEKLADAEEAAHQAKDDLLRIQAEMHNLRRRTEQDIEKAHKYGQERFSSELLTVMDNLERSLEAASKHEDEAVKAIYDGVDLTLKSFTDCFSRFQIVAVDPMGEPFDPQLHQAMSIQENTEVEPNTVVAVMQKGYTLHGRVIRPAMVMVSKDSESD
ncbi:MAG: nucleotide exchange factor GrpE [Gammaproteobacteria bacterium]|mgnify:CR=1 FL=1|jgi:molecular chaperone GrpE|nr:nucleotide exchange factor GrpE [Gammaproteobacteria bacterium]MDP6537074.1 nucleotide exchange factor GrpE [Gammaproteobacteria bacterium]MDP6733756.1 nucleotide exchange factor GrpE [Gammaproteobacteria bacterium]HAJ75611.1 nucleotide exchange factor GrpE [Gammaproteobacteria bacterium]|tara:strand:+ start:660 stop:1286 length:627 start_codon:yes stop_codon:yes gene_type:complete